jgi:hypothetical protein
VSLVVEIVERWLEGGCDIVWECRRVVLDERGESVGLSFGDVRPLPAGDGGEGFTSFEKKPGAIVTVV